MRGSVSAAVCGVMVMPGVAPQRVGVRPQRLVLENVTKHAQVAGVEHPLRPRDEVPAARDVDHRAAELDFSQCPA